ncbi:MAG TPA: hypothetical protein VK474_04165 [Chthoniobacterales bacterium]|nr:hypothetical protein [Chthoniobacterales bacterium]
MNRLLLFLLGTVALFLGGCSQGLVEDTGQAPDPASYAADPNAQVQPPPGTPVGGASGY